MKYKGREIEIDNFIACIPNEQLKMVLGKANYKHFIKFMFGSCSPIGGFYKWDLERWLNSEKK